MKRTISVKAAVTVAVVAVSAALAPVWAQEETASPADGEEAAAVVAQKKITPDKAFYPLFRVTRATGAVEVLRPSTTEWVAAENGHFYALGTTLRTRSDAVLEVKFGDEAKLTVVGAAEFVTEASASASAQTRAVVVKEGTLQISLPMTLPEGAFAVKAPFFVCGNLAGDSRIEYRSTGDGDEAVVRCVTGTMSVEGRHYRIARMAAANQLRIRSTGDDLFTSLRGESGDCKVVLDQGVFAQKDFESGETKNVARTLEYSLTPQCAIKIHRAKASQEGKMIVCTMTFDGSGNMKNRCVFAEGNAALNSGELVISVKNVEESAPATKAEDGETEAVEVAPADGEEKENKADSEN